MNFLLKIYRPHKFRIYGTGEHLGLQSHCPHCEELRQREADYMPWETIRKGNGKCGWFPKS